MTTQKTIPEAKQVKQAVHELLRNWHKPATPPDIVLASFVLVKQQENPDTNLNPDPALPAKQAVLLILDDLAKQNEESAAILRARFIEGASILQVVRDMSLSEDQVKRRQRFALEELTHTLLAREEQVRHEEAERLASALEPSSYTQLFGIDDTHQTFVDNLLRPDQYWIVTLIGIGGIGKTSLADAICRALIPYFYFKRIIWIRIDGSPKNAQASLDHVMLQIARALFPVLPSHWSTQQRDIEVRQQLKTDPYLIVLDNIESQVETDLMISHLSDFANPSKFLITTRVRPSVARDVFQHWLSELPLEACHALIQQQAQAIGLYELADLTLEDSRRIHDVVGGNPLALKLIVSLATILPLPQILQDLIEVNAARIEQLYRHIYLQAWQSISGQARQLLEIMPLVGDDGAGLPQIEGISGLSRDQIWGAIQELAGRSLLEVRGTTWDRRYGIHRLTESFLRTEIIHWPEEML